VSGLPIGDLSLNNLSANLLPAAIAVGVNSTLPHTSPKAYTPSTLVF
jgi:hypothetical protein